MTVTTMQASLPRPGLLPTPPARYSIGCGVWEDRPNWLVVDPTNFGDCGQQSVQPPTASGKPKQPIYYSPPPADPLEARGVHCLDRALLECGDKLVLLGTRMQVNNTQVRCELKNSFVDYHEVSSDDEGCRRRMSCPDLRGNEPVNGYVQELPPPPPPPPVGITTYMIRNIPTRFTSITFVRLLEDYGFRGTFNFFYLPMDFRSGKNMGYAFINFLDPGDGVRFATKFDSRRLPVSTSKKVIEISPSRRQGLMDNIALFRTSDLLNSVSLPHYKPLIATPETGGKLVPLSDHNFPPL